MMHKTIHLYQKSLLFLAISKPAAVTSEQVMESAAYLYRFQQLHQHQLSVNRKNRHCLQKIVAAIKGLFASEPKEEEKKQNNRNNRNSNRNNRRNQDRS